MIFICLYVILRTGIRRGGRVQWHHCRQLTGFSISSNNKLPVICQRGVAFVFINVTICHIFQVRNAQRELNEHGRREQSPETCRLVGQRNAELTAKKTMTSCAVRSVSRRVTRPIAVRLVPCSPYFCSRRNPVAVRSSGMQSSWTKQTSPTVLPGRGLQVPRTQR
jgi:hypothetical protein